MINKKKFEEVQHEVEEIAQKWMKRERKQMTKTELLQKLDDLYNKVKADSDMCEQLRRWVYLTIKLDENVENSHSVLIGTCVSMVLSIISIIISILTSMEIIQGMMVGVIMILVIFIVMIALIVLFPIVKKHGGGYAREKAFYELLLERLEKNEK